MRIDPTCRSIIQQKRYLVDLQVGPILIFVRAANGLVCSPAATNFFPPETGGAEHYNNDERMAPRCTGAHTTVK
jgi:hypothetical protein